MELKIFLKNSCFALLFVNFSACSDKNESSKDAEIANEISVTSDVLEKGFSFASIEGFVNLVQITSSYSSYKMGIEYSTDSSFKNAKQNTTQELVGRKIIVDLFDLEPNELYYYRTFVHANNVYYYGETRSFKTNDLPNVTSMISIENITLTSAYVKGLCNENLLQDSREKYKIGIAWSETKSKLVDDGNFNFKETGVYYGKIDGKIEKLKAGVNYYVTTVIISNKKSKIANVQEFTTIPLGDGNIKTGEAYDITLTSAKLSATSTFTYLPSMVYKFHYSTDSNFKTYMTTSSTTDLSKESFVEITNLEPNTQYYYYVYATVEDYSFTSDINSFKTKNPKDYLITGEAKNVDITTATLTGYTSISQLYANNNMGITYGILYSNDKNLTSAKRITSEEKDGLISVEITGLSSGTQYFYAVYAIINNSIYESEIKSFTTISNTNTFNEYDSLWEYIKLFGDKDNPVPFDDMLSGGFLYVEFVEKESDVLEIDDMWVEGYIVGYVKSRSMDTTVFDAGSVSSNIVIAESKGENNFEKCVPVQLSNSSKSNQETRAALNLKDNPNVLGKKVKIRGDIGKYMGVVGVKNAKECEFE